MRCWPRGERRLATVFLVAAMLVASLARAATVVLVQPARPAPGMTQALVRIHGELVSAGFALEVVEAAGSDGGKAVSLAWLEGLAVRRGADAVVAMIGDESPDSVEVWVIDKVTGKSLVRRVPYQPASARGPETLAIQAIELLRASFLEIDLGAGRASEHARPEPTVVRFVEHERSAERRSWLGVAGGGATMMSLDGVGPTVLPVVRVETVVRPWLLAHVTCALPGFRPTVRTEAGSAKVTQAFGALGASYRFRAAARLRPFLGVSSGLLHTAVDGRPDARSADEGLHAQRWSWLFDAGGGADLALSQRLHLALAASLQLAQPYPAVRFAGAVVATSARPSLLFTLTVGAWL